VAEGYRVKGSAVATDIISRTDCSGPPALVWTALLRAAGYDQDTRTLHLDNATIKVRSLCAGVGIRGKARWAGVPYRVTAYLVPHGESTRLVLTTTAEPGPDKPSALRLRTDRRLATRDLQRWAVATSVESANRWPPEGALTPSGTATTASATSSAGT